MICRNCGTQNEVGTEFCKNCGFSLKSPLDLAYAGFWRRAAAFVIDDLLMTLVVAAGLWIAVTHSWAAMLYVLIAIRWVYFAGMESSRAQGTVGKIVSGIKVTDVLGNRISFFKATLRYFSKLLSILLFFGGYAMVLITERRQGLHDKIAGTVVVLKEDSHVHEEYTHPLYAGLRESYQP